ncbi:FtsX-like permease family protein [Candidatus Kaiserbacteria bacterium]|nr:FtsX-like permease family protein [Candidatus Kaiserbacteria bacterium]
MFSWLNIRIGWFLAVRQLRRASKWTTSLIVFVMVLTFLNLVVVSGILVGLIQGAVHAVQEKYLSDVIVSPLSDKDFIENSVNILALARSLPEVEAATPRFRKGIQIEANYKTRNEGDKANMAGAQLVGIDLASEKIITNLSENIIEGSFLESGDYDQVVLGHYLLKQYLPIESPAFTTLEDVHPGSKVRLRIGHAIREVTVKGILKTKVDEVSMSAFMLDAQVRGLIGRDIDNLSEIAIKLKKGADPVQVRDELLLRGMGEYAKIQTFEEGQPKFLKDMIKTFDLLGAGFSSIGLVVASITIFIVIFINALTRRKFIGILKGIGIDGHAIEISYIFQSIFYAVLGSVIGLVLVYAVLIPFFEAHPIDFPFSDGILVAPLNATLGRVALLVFTTLIAGYIPAWMIVRKNTLDSILGRE